MQNIITVAGIFLLSSGLLVGYAGKLYIVARTVRKDLGRGLLYMLSPVLIYHAMLDEVPHPGAMDAIRAGVLLAAAGVVVLSFLNSGYGLPEGVYSNGLLFIMYSYFLH